MKTAWYGLLPIALASSLGCQSRGLSICDITQGTCQEDIYYRMLDLRGDGYDPFGGLPPIGVISEDQYRQQLLEEQAKSAQDGPDPWARALGLLHFSGTAASPDAGAGGDGSGDSNIEDQVKHVYAFYDPTTKTVTVISHPGQNGDSDLETGMITLAHEFVHALQDREVDLNRQDFASTDDYFSWDAMIEGDARFYEYLFMNQLYKLGYTQKVMAQMPERELDYVYQHFDEAGAPLFAARLLIYPLGAKYLATAFQNGGNAAVRHAYAKAPNRTVGLLTDDGRVPAAATGQACEAPYVSSLPIAGKTSGADQFGALLFYTFLRGWNVDHETAFSAAQTWTGDYLRIQTATDFSTTAVAWRLEFSAPPSAGLAQALTQTGELTVVTGSRSLQVQATDATIPVAWSPSGHCP